MACVCVCVCVCVQERCSVLDKDKVKAVADLAALRRQFDEREVQFRLQVAAPHAPPACSSRLSLTADAHAASALA